MNEDDFLKYSSKIVTGDGTNHDTLTYASAQDAAVNVYHILTSGVFHTDSGWVAIKPGYEMDEATTMFLILCDMMGWEMPNDDGSDNND